jgi:hypothetical protein
MSRAHPALTDEHDAVRDTMRRFVATSSRNSWDGEDA